MKHLSACLSIALVLLLFNSFSLQAQGHFNPPAYTPHFDPVFHPMGGQRKGGRVTVYHPPAHQVYHPNTRFYVTENCLLD